ncbi:MAG: hypothetical protein E7289_01800 [Lachnospiraceae bacterium]|nr:hypothetical protein [Lachnospiraceae bacterium]
MEEKSGIGKKILVIILCVLFLAVIGLGIILWQMDVFSGGEGNKTEETAGGKFKKSEDEDSKFKRGDSEGVELTNEGDDSDLVASADSDVAYDSMSEDEKFAYTLEWIGDQNPQYKVIDYTANEQTPAERNPDLEWDKTLFYTLEDASMENQNDGLINLCDISKVQVKNKETGNLVECELYKQNETGEIQKIVTIEKQDETGLYEVWEYYFQSGKINFIFYSLRDVYTPTYATVDKCGERYYYNSDSLVKFRRIEVPLEVQDFLVKDLHTYEEHLVAGFNNLEVVGLTRAHNVYNAVQNIPIYGTLNGYLYDCNNEPISGALVTATNNHYNQQAGEVKTNEEGYYSMMVPADEEGDYSLKVSQGEDEVDVFGVKVGKATTSVVNETIYMPIGDQKDEMIPMQIILCDALNTSGGGDAFSNMERLPYAQLKIRKGVNNKTGEVYGTYTADADGVVSAELPAGMYTGEILHDGYENSYFTIAAKADNTLMQSMTTPKLAEGEMRIVLTWNDYPNDLDSHLFTPYQGSAGDMQHIGYYEQSDDYGNNLDVDDTNGYGPETMTILNLTSGNYKYYVSNYTKLASGVTDDTSMSLSNATVRVYSSGGLQAVFNVPPNQPGTIWEVFEIRNGRILPIQRYYSNVDDKSWWMSY